MRTPAQTIPESPSSSSNNSCPTQPQPDDLSRNLFPEPLDDNDDVDDPFAVDADFSDQLGLIETFDPVKFLLSHVRIDVADPELVEPMLIYCLHRTAKLPNSGVPAYLTTQAQEVIEIALRTERHSLVSLMQQCRDGTARYSNSHLLCGASLQDSPGQLFMMDSTIKSKFLNILGICTSLYLTSNCALLCDITELVQRLIVGQAKSHGLKQLVVGHTLERIEIWLARRKSVFDDLHNACSMLGLFAEMPGPCALVTDAMSYALNPAFVSILRVVVRQNGVPRNALTWTDFEYLLADTQLQIDADPACISDALKPTAPVRPDIRPDFSPAVIPAAVHQDLRPTARPQPDDSSGRPPAAIGPGIGDRFPASVDECKDCSLTCKDCKAAFDFTASEQSFYVRIMDQPNYPLRCSPCRIPRRKFFDDKDKAAQPAAAHVVLAAGIDPAVDTDPVPAPSDPAGPAMDNWDEVLRFADGEEDFEF